jgi:isopentenyl diphosphate isomerase/L-lactate dehydrogenase-like FMN-dependent dehydrogenase
MGCFVLPNRKDVAWLVSITSLPVVVRGVLHTRDAEHALRAGAAGIIVAHPHPHTTHHLDGAPSAIECLHAVAAACKGRALKVMVECDVRKSSDVLKALGLGACAVLASTFVLCLHLYVRSLSPLFVVLSCTVLSGRPALCGLAVDGERGAARVMERLCAELRADMQALGVGSVAELDHRILHK